MIIYSEILHIATNKVFACNGFQLTPGTEEEKLFQNSTEENILKDDRVTFIRIYEPLIEEEQQF